MTVFGRRISLGAAVLALFIAGQACAQEDLDSGKTPAQLYASNCAICHKTPNGLSKAGGPFGLEGFLREHYTASRKAAAAIAAYVDAVDRGPPPVERGPKRAAKPKEVGKPGDAKASKAKAEPKSESKSEPKSESKSEAKGSEPAKPQDKPAEAKPAEAKPSDPAPAEPKPVEAKVDAGKPAAKPASTPPTESKPDSEKKPN
jgi:hypothetical protein